MFFFSFSLSSSYRDVIIQLIRENFARQIFAIFANFEQICENLSRETRKFLKSQTFIKISIPFSPFSFPFLSFSSLSEVLNGFYLISGWKTLISLSNEQVKTLEISILIFETCLFAKMYLVKLSEIAHSQKFVRAKVLKFLICEN